MEKQAWYNNKSVVVLLCIFFFPVGLYAIWKSEVVKFGWKIGYTVIIALVLLGSLSPKTEPTQKVETNPYATSSEMAYVMAQNFIRVALKSPSTADFPFTDYKYKQTDSVTHVVQSYVDSENGFGAMVRSNYTITLEFKGGSDIDQRNWEVRDVVLE